MKQPWVYMCSPSRFHGGVYDSNNVMSLHETIILQTSVISIGNNKLTKKNNLHQVSYEFMFIVYMNEECKCRKKVLFKLPSLVQSKKTAGPVATLD